MASSSSYHPTSLSCPLVPIHALTRIPLLKPDSSTDAVAVVSTDTKENSLSIFDQTNVLRIYQGKTILFFGDSTIRSLYRDLSRLLHKGKLMNDMELKKEHSDHKLYANEIQLEISGSRGMRNRVDCRRFVCKESSTVLYFIHLGTIFNAQNRLNIEWLKQITEYSPIDIVVTSCAYPDLSLLRLKILHGDFQTTLQTFKSELPIVLTKLKLTFYDHEQRHPIMIWVPPIPSKILDDQENHQFGELLNVCLDITNQFQFKHLTRMQPWLDHYKSLYVNEGWYLSSVGECTTIDDWLKRIIFDNLGLRHLTTQIIEITTEKRDCLSQRDLLEPIGTPNLMPRISIPMMDSIFPSQIDEENEYQKIMMEKRRNIISRKKILKRKIAKTERAKQKRKRKKLKNKIAKA